MSTVTISTSIPETGQVSIVDKLLAPLDDADDSATPTADVPGPIAAPDTVEVTDELDSYFLAPLLECDSLIDFPSEPKDLPLSESVIKHIPSVNPQSLVAAFLQGLEPAQLKTLIGDTIQTAVREAVAALKPAPLGASKPATSDVPSYADVVATKSNKVTTNVVIPAPPITPSGLPTPPPSPKATMSTRSANGPSPMVVDDKGFQTVTRRGNTNRYPTIDHPFIRRTSYTIFKFDDPSRHAVQLLHVGQILLFCTASARIIEDNYRFLTLPAGYVSFATAFNNGARLTPKRFATFNIHTSVPIIPSDPITIADFRIDRDLIRTLERNSPRTTPNIYPDSSKSKKSVTFKTPGEGKPRKRGDTPYPHSALRRGQSQASGPY